MSIAEKKKKKKEYDRRRNLKKKQEATKAEIQDRQEIELLRQKRSMSGRLSSNDFSRLKQLEDLYFPEAYDYGSDEFYSEIDDRSVGGDTTVQPFVRAKTLDRGAETPTPYHLRGLDPEALDRIKRGESSLAFGRTSPKTQLVDLEGNPILDKKKKKDSHWGQIIGV